MNEDKDTGKIVEDYKEEFNNNPILKEHNQKIVNGRWHRFLKFFFFTIILAGMGFFLFLVYDGSFKSEINHVVNLEPQINNTIKVDNSYDFDPITNNKYYNNHTIFITNIINVPE